jgi:WD40 repeat protein
LVSKKKIFNATSAIVAIAVTPDDQYAAVSAFMYGEDPSDFKEVTIVLWDLDKSTIHHSIKEPEPEHEFKPEPIVALYCTRTDQLVYGGYQGLIKCFNISKKKEEFRIEIEKKKIYSILVTKDSRFMYVADNHNWINRYDFKTKEDLSSNFDSDYLVGLIFDENEKKIYSILGGRTVRVFLADEEITRLNTIGHDLLVSVKATNDQIYIVGFYLNGGVIFFDSKSGTISRYYESFSEGWELFEKYSELGVKLDDEEIDYN